MIQKILIVDDSKATRTMVSRAFRPYACEIIEGTNGEEAVSMAREHAPSLIVLDITMPVMNGLEALEKMRSEPATASIPVIMLSAHGDPLKVTDLKMDPLVHYLTKAQRPGLVLEQAMKFISLVPQESVGTP